ncbi:MAG: ABC transporter permease, partial [Acetobacteraceae bacterium]|nr:ABC transporter permease [Acetobacteraceae bacterium]
MIRFLGRRLLVAVPTLLIVSMLVFGLQSLLPGDPAVALAGEDPSPEVLTYLREKYRFDQPVPVQYAHWLGSFVQGDFGTSVRTKLPIGQTVAERLPVTIELSVLAMLLAVVVGIPAGVLAALR